MAKGKKSISVDFYAKTSAGRSPYGPCSHQAALDEIAKGALDPNACCRAARDGFSKAPLWAGLIIGGADSATLDSLAASGCLFGAGAGAGAGARAEPSVFAAAKIAICKRERAEPLLWALRQAQAGKLPLPPKDQLDDILFSVARLEARFYPANTARPLSQSKSPSSFGSACDELRKAGASLSPEHLGKIWAGARLNMQWLASELKARPLPPGSEHAFTKAAGNALKEAGPDTSMFEDDLDDLGAAFQQNFAGIPANPFAALKAAKKSPKTNDDIWQEWVQSGAQAAKLGLPLDIRAACKSGQHCLVAMASASVPPDSLQGTGLLSDWLHECLGGKNSNDKQALMAFAGLFSARANPWAHCAAAARTLIDLGAPFDVAGRNRLTAKESIERALSGKNPAAAAYGMLGSMGLNNAQSLAGLLGMMGMGSGIPGQGTPDPANPKTREDFLEFMRIALERHALDKAASQGKNNGPAHKSI